ncbi:AAA family ATPase [Paracoccus sp. S-4012]|uniref:AAA family ATPase n=1 Tax=Paracoccus sp. S-4012 TaxID=2665648 RepID=UPI0012B084A5|nr:AAA family ATPase [Paracoccus sp. S-4012]MRX49446.1 AAA family ATPase [Paracoccus sp. S-4012]
MAIERISLLRNVGQFDNVSSGAQVPLTPFAVIYAENGRGKTTLSAILKSLGSGDPSLIQNRKRLKAQHHPHVIVQLSGAPTIFKDGAWSVTQPEIHVFDDAFVAENVCSGIEVETSHRQNLHELILGARGVALSKALQGHVERIEQHNKDMRAKQDAIPAAARGPFSVDAFCGLSPNKDIDKEIEEAERRLAAAKAADAIHQRAAFQTLNLPGFDRDRIRDVLARSLPDLEGAAAALVRDHLRKLGRDGESWVAEGMPRLEAASAGLDHKACPFCAQDLAGSTLIPHYQAYFSDAYSQLKDDIRTLGQGIAADHSGEVMAGFERSVRDASEIRDFWKAFTPIPDIRVDTAAVVWAWTAARESVLEILRAKAASPLEPMQLPDQAVEAVAAFDEQRRSVAEAFDNFLACNEAIKTVKEQAASADVSALESDLVRLKSIKARLEPDVAAKCNDYLKEKAEKAKTEAARTKAREALDKYRETIFPAYEVAINAYLAKFNAGFRLGSVTSVNNRGGSAANYHVVINNENVSLTADAGPSFRTTLSAGDRNTLALAFFFSSLEQAGNLADKILVIDDPMTSLDEHRSLTTMEVMRELYDQVRQIIVLSHSKPFLCDLWASADKNGRSSARIARSNTGSTIMAWDVSADAVTEHDRRHKLVRDYLQAADHTKEREVAAALRHILESYMRVACPTHCPPERLLGNLLIECEKKVGGQDEILSSVNVKELKQLLGYANRFHHDTNPAWQTVLINDAELVGYAERTLKFCSRN